MTLAAHALRALVLIYRYTLSSLIGRSCRFLPTCSEYARVVVLKYGVLRGLFLGAGRVLRCHPLHPGGIDLP